MRARTGSAVALDHGEAGNARIRHAVDHHAQRLVGIGFDGIGAGELAQGDRSAVCFRIFERAAQIIARHHAHQVPLSVHHGQQALAAAMVGLDGQGRGLEGHVRAQRGDIGAHHLADEENLQGINGVLAAQVIAAAADLFRQDGAPQREYRGAIGHAHGNQERQESAGISRHFKREHDAGQRGAQSSSEHRAHAHQRPEAHARVREDQRLRAAQRPANHQYWSEHAAGGA